MKVFLPVFNALYRVLGYGVLDYGVLRYSILGLVSSAAFAQSPAVSHPCESIKESCEKAGFIKGEYKIGKGLWKDCIDPLIQGKAVSAALPLPTVDPAVVAACKAKHPNFGEEKKAK